MVGQDLVEISVLLSPEAERAKGVIARITTEVALHDVSIHGTVCVAPEFIILVDEKDAIRAYEALQRMLTEASISSNHSRTPPLLANA